MAAGDLAGAETALQGLDKFNGFEPLKMFQLGLLYDFAGKPDKAQGILRQGARRERAAELAGDRRRRQFLRAARPRRAGAGALRPLHPAEQPAAIWRPSVAGDPRGRSAKPPIGSPADGLAEAMFDLASVLNQPETIDLALLYDRFALELRPQFPLAQLLLADILSAQNKPEESLAVLARDPARARPITGRRGCAPRSISTRSTAPTRRSRS